MKGGNNIIKITSTIFIIGIFSILIPLKLKSTLNKKSEKEVKFRVTKSYWIIMSAITISSFIALLIVV